MKLHVVILTGGREGHYQLLAGTGLKHKALLPIGGKPMVLSVMEAAKASRYHPDIYISTDDSDIIGILTDIPFQTLPIGKTAVQSIVMALRHLPNDTQNTTPWVLFISADHPLLTTDMIDYFIEHALQDQKDFYVAVVSKKRIQAAYPESRRSYLPVKGDAFSGANMYLVNKNAFTGQTRYMETVDRNRKAHWKSILGLDPLSILQGLFRRLNIHELISRADPLVGFRCGAVEMPWAEACMDVDKVSDRIIAERILAQRQNASSTSVGEPHEKKISDILSVNTYSR